jgi:hypothetical protein
MPRIRLTCRKRIIFYALLLWWGKEDNPGAAGVELAEFVDQGNI